MNYQRLMEEEIEKLTYKPKLLLHVCCGPCSTYVLKYLQDYFDVTLYFYNPNIDTLEEYNLRVKEAKKVVNSIGFSDKIVIDAYNPEVFKKLSSGLEKEKEGGKRCIKCINERLSNSFKYAKDNNFEYITTTLTISPHKNSQLINNLGKRLAHLYDIKYLYSDFKKKDGYKKSIDLSKELNLYRQDYCGCVYSKKEMEVRLESRKNSSGLSS